MALALVLSLSGCASLEAYSRRAGRDACAALDRCTVYDDSGKHEVPCFWLATERRMVYPGDRGWPFEPGVCEATPASESSS
jgi:hypothetical protein